ncbi:MAG TPA: hypothetical protein VND64_35470 [Pirellulales bacterium]|nr:hypothetical protein [Pirellulales bacterium]
MSTSDDLRVQFTGQVRVLQIIVAAITLGPLTYLGVVFSTAPPDQAAGEVQGMFNTFLACGMAAAAVVAWLVVPPLVTTKFRRQIAAGAWPPLEQTGNPLAAPLNDAGKLSAVYHVRTIIAVAILEGATFFLVFTYQQQRDTLALGFAVLLMLMIALHFPTRARVADWVERQLVRLSDDRDAEQFRR